MLMKYSYAAVSAATGYGREAVALYAEAHGWERGLDLFQIVEFVKAMRKKGNADPAKVAELRAVLRGAGLL